MAHPDPGQLRRLAVVSRDMLSGTRVEPLVIAGVPVADAICFDVAYDDGINAQIERGGELLVVQTSNATFIHTSQIRQQFAITRLRAIETHRAVAVAATNGVSGLIGPDGQVVAPADVRTRTVLVESLPLSDEITPGVRVGPWLGRGAVAATAVGLLAAWVAYRRARTRTERGSHRGHRRPRPRRDGRPDLQRGSEHRLDRLQAAHGRPGRRRARRRRQLPGRHRPARRRAGARRRPGPGPAPAGQGRAGRRTWTASGWRWERATT